MIMQPIRIAIADDEALIRKGLGLLIDDWDDITTILYAQDGQDLINQLHDKSDWPDVLLLDLKMPNLDGIDTAKILCEKYDSIKIIVLSTIFNKAFVLNMLEIGASSYLPKNTDPTEFERAIREVATRGFYYSTQVLEFIRDNLTSKTRIKPRLSFNMQLSDREREILELICNQFTTSEIAKKLYLSPRTVDGYRNNLLSKLGCRNTAGLVAYAIQHQLVEIRGSHLFEQH